VWPRLHLDLRRDVAEDDAGHDPREPVAHRRPARQRHLGLRGGERRELDAVDAAVAGLVGGGGEPAGIGPASYGVDADPEQICGLAQPIKRHVRQGNA
jgi:hypothetical protein